MRIRESAYMALLCLFIPAYNSVAQTSVIELYGGCRANVTSIRPETSGKWDIQFLSQPKRQLQGVQAGNKAMFSSITGCEIYNFTSGNWQTHQFSISRRGISAVASKQKAFFAGGARGPQSSPEFVNRVDVYNSGNDRWYQSALSQAREVGGAGSNGNILIFAGGVTSGGFSDRADIFNTGRRNRYQYTLSDPRSKIAVGSASNKIVFAGGISGKVKSPVSSNAVDIYELHTNTWRTGLLSEKRHDIAVASIGNKIIFAGGHTVSASGTQLSNTVDIYDAVQDTWKTTKLSEAKHGMSVAVAAGKVYFAGGLLKDDVLSNRIEIYDLKTDSWTVTTLAAGRYGMAVAVTDSRVIFAGGFVNNLTTTTNLVQVLNIANDKWSTEYLSQPRANIAVAACEDRILFAGGTDYTGKNATATTDIWESSAFVRDAGYTASTNNKYFTRRKQINEWVYADPENRDYIIADLWRYETQTVKISILNALRQLVLTKSVIPFGDTKEQISVANLPNGRYWVFIECNGRKPLLTQVNIGHEFFDPGASYKMLAMAPYSIPGHFTSQY